MATGLGGGAEAPDAQLTVGGGEGTGGSWERHCYAPLAHRFYSDSTPIYLLAVVDVVVVVVLDYSTLAGLLWHGFRDTYGVLLLLLLLLGRCLDRKGVRIEGELLGVYIYNWVQYYTRSIVTN